MPIDSMFIKGLAEELNNELAGARIDKIYMPSRDQVILNIRSERGSRKLVLSIGAYPAVWITEQKYENPDVPPMFCMLLRKHIGNGRVISVTQPERERIIIVNVLAMDEMGDISEKRVICELLGKQKNIIIANSNWIISACLRNIGFDVSERAVLPGLAYSFPPKACKANWLDMSESELKNVFEDAPTADPEKHICSQVSGLTFSLARQALAAPCPYKWLYNTGKTEIAPYIVLTEVDGKRTPSDLSAVKPFEEYDRAESFSKALDSFYGRKSTENNIKALKRDMDRVLNNLIKRTENKLSGQRIELKTAAEREKIKEKADLITANIGIIRPGEKLIRVKNYYDPLMPEVTMEIDPLFSPQQNAQRLYKKYARLKSAEMHLTEQIEKGNGELEYYKSLLYSLSDAENMQEINAVKEELRSAGIMKSVKGKVKLTPPAPRKFFTDGGFVVLCGRNNTENDYLTHKAASKKDIWFHARNIAGSHVILITDGKEPSESDIGQAASIAAYYCSAKGVATTVDYTLVKNVRKPNGARPGAVNYFEYKSILAKPELPISK